MTENAQRRSEGRARRRSADHDRPGKAKENESDGGMENVHQAVRTAAAAAAVGAAVGAARALASRGGDDGRSDVEENEHERSGQEPEPQGQAQEPEPQGQAQEPEPQDGDGDQDAEQEPTAEDHPQPQRARTRRERAPSREARPRHGESTGTVRSIADRAREQLRELHGREPESLTSLERIGDGWRATFEVLELARIPSSTDVLATYVVEVDDKVQLLSFERVRRYVRAQADHGDDR